MSGELDGRVALVTGAARGQDPDATGLAGPDLAGPDLAGG